MVFDFDINIKILLELITMIIDDKINNLRNALKKCDLCSINDKKIFDSILDILQDISTELDELNESMTY